jgi:hypothetical protein
MILRRALLLTVPRLAFLQVTTLQVTTMAHFAGLDFDKAHLVRAVDWVESALVVGLIGAGLVACALGAVIYDVGRLFSAW